MPEQQQNSISLRELVRIAAKVYTDDEPPDGDESAWDEVIDSNGRLVARGELGDTLADFIIIELAETYDPKASREEQLEEAQRSMNAAIMQLDRVALTFAELQST
jgi:hypothetical protein